MLDFQEEDMLKRLKRYFNFYKHEARGAASYLWPVLGTNSQLITAWLLCAHVSPSILHDHQSKGLKEIHEIPFSLKTRFWQVQAAIDGVKLPALPVGGHGTAIAPPATW